MEENDRRLWKRLGRGGPASSAAGCPDANALGGFLEGRFSEGDRQGIEAHLVDCGACLETLIELRGSLGEPLVAVPDHLLQRIQDLVPGEPATGRLRLAPALAESMAVAAALAVACLLGFTIGSQASWDRAKVNLQAQASFRLGIGPDLADWPPEEGAP